jgi:hypothetical protein
MTQFKIQDWAGYVRGVLAPEQRQQMADLLNQGCPESTRFFELATQVHNAGPFLTQPGAPPATLRRAFAIFPAKESTSFWQIPLLPMSLVFDSLLDAEPAGFRSIAVQARRSIYEGEGVQLRLSVEPDLNTGLLAVVGQLVAATATTSISARPILIYQKENMIARTLSSEHGEFHLEFFGRDPLRLVLLMDNPSRRIEVEIVPNPLKKTKREA